MTRRLFLLPAVLWIGCKGRQASPEALLPQSMEGGWHRTALVTAGVASAPELLRRLGLAQVYKGVYEGPAAAAVTVYVMAAPTSAFEAAQKWQPEADSVFFYQEQYFVHVGWKKADRGAISRLVRGLEKHLKSLAG